MQFYHRQISLGERCKQAHVTRMQIAMALNRTPTTVQAWLSGYVIMPDEAQRRVEEILAEREQSVTTDATGSDK